MKISKLILDLQVILDEDGDLDVFFRTKLPEHIGSSRNIEFTIVDTSDDENVIRRDIMIIDIVK